MIRTQRAIGRRPEVTSLGFGGAPIGNLYDVVSEEDAQSAIETAFALGVRYFDTAPFYGYGLSEARIGRALTGRPRDSYVISTKVGRLLEWNPAEARGTSVGDQFVVARGRAAFDYSRDGVFRSFETSLARLGVDRIDILLLHDIGAVTHGARHPEILRAAIDQALPAMAELRDCGAVNAIGIGVNEQDVVLEVLPHFPVDCVMLAGRYTLLEQQDSVELMAYAYAHDVPVLIAGAYNSGLLAPTRAPGATYNYLPVDAAVLDRACALYAECASAKVDVGAAALQFPLAHPVVASVTVGLRSAAEVMTAVARIRAELPTHLWKRLKDVGLLPTDAYIPKDGT